MGIELYDHQKEALNKLHNGSILCGGVGSGKSITSIAYYFSRENNGEFDKVYRPMTKPNDLYIITTAMKRDSKEWEHELLPFLLSPDNNVHSNKVKIDSWNNIQKYTEVTGAFFIFDEQRVVGSGAWVKAFLKIVKNNHWILLTATPGDTWLDYIPVFIANGFYKNRTEFKREHVVYSRFSKYPKVDRYIGCGRLLKYKNRILVRMDYKRPTRSHNEWINLEYDKKTYLYVTKERYDIFNDKPLKDASALCYALRRIVNSDPSRIEEVAKLYKDHPRMIIFYNFNYELEALYSFAKDKGINVAQWNGHKHEPLPTSDSWLYLVQYTAGAEGWNCITTDTIVFFSQNYSYKSTVQAAGRIDRMNTPYTDLYYYHLKSKSSIDNAIHMALKKKKNFNERGFAG